MVGASQRYSLVVSPLHSQPDSEHILLFCPVCSVYAYAGVSFSISCCPPFNGDFLYPVYYSCFRVKIISHSERVDAIRSKPALKQRAIAT
jgi:hypothetical protein